MLMSDIGLDTMLMLMGMLQVHVLKSSNDTEL